MSDLNGNTYGIDGGNVYVELTWTVPLNSMQSAIFSYNSCTFSIIKNATFKFLLAAKSQLVRYSESDAQLLNDFGAAPTATIVYGNLNDVTPGTSIYIYANAPYNKGKNVYFIVETTGNNNEKVSCSTTQIHNC